MSRVKNMSRGGWIVIGILIAMMLVPTGIATATALKYSGIEGTSANKADVTSAGQLLTTEAKPTSYQSYFVPLGNVTLSAEDYCEAVTPTLPSGDAYDVQDVTASIDAAGQQQTDGAMNDTNAEIIFVVASSSANVCTTDTYSSALGEAVPQGGDPGTIDLPQRPGFVIPNGYQLYALGYYVEAGVFANGYLIPSSDAPSTPTVTHDALLLPQGPKG